MGPAVAQPLGTKKATGWEPRSWASVWCLIATQVTDISTDSDCGRTTGQDLVLDNSLSSDVILALAGIADHQDWHSLSDDMVPKHQHVPR